MSDATFLLVRKVSGEAVPEQRVGGYAFFNHIAQEAYEYHVVAESQHVSQSLNNQTSDSCFFLQLDRFLDRCQEVAWKDLRELPLMINDPSFKAIAQVRLKDSY